MADLIFIHGAADSGEVWELQTDSFAGGNRVLAVDLPGHGARLTETPLDTVDNMADEVVRLAREQRFEQPVLIGHSMGGVITLSIGLRYPDLPRALVLAGSGARLRMRPIVLEYARVAAAEAAPGELAPPQIELDQVVSGAARAEVRNWLTDRFRQATAQATYADFMAIHEFDALDRLGEIQQPVLIVAGEEDAWTPPRFQRYLAEHLPHGRLVIISNTGHYPFVEQAPTFNAVLSRFLDELD